MKNIKGYVNFVLHAHLPYVHHPECDTYLEEEWLHEAISETYIPLLLNFGKLVEEKVDFRITMTITPTLLSMLDSKLLQERYIKYLENIIDCNISLKGYSKYFLQALKDLSNIVYSIPNTYRPQQTQGNRFSPNINNTLNQMKKNY